MSMFNVHGSSLGYNSKIVFFSHFLDSNSTVNFEVFEPTLNIIWLSWNFAHISLTMWKRKKKCRSKVDGGKEYDDSKENENNITRISIWTNTDDELMCIDKSRD